MAELRVLGVKITADTGEFNKKTGEAITQTKKFQLTTAKTNEEILKGAKALGIEADQIQITTKHAATKVAQLRELEKGTKSYGAQVKKTTGSMRSFKGATANLGFQLQDIAVQAQAGQDAFIIFGQQGSQLASSLGPSGPLIGAVIALSGALAGALYPSLTNTGAEAEALSEIIEKRLEPAIKRLQEAGKDEAAIADVLTIERDKLNDKIDKTIKKLYAQRDVLSALEKQAQTGGEEALVAWTTQLGAIERTEKALKELNAEKTKLTEAGVGQKGLKGLNTEQEEADLAALQERIDDLFFGGIASEGEDIAAARLAREEELMEALFKRELAMDADLIAGDKARVDAQEDISSELDALEDERHGRLRQRLKDTLAKAKADQKEYSAWLDDQQKMREAAASKLSSIGYAIETGGTDPFAAEIAAHEKRNEELKDLMVDPYADQIEVNRLMEAEQQRHTDAMNAIGTAMVANELSTWGTFLSSAESTMGQLADLADEGSGEAKALFAVTKAIAFANAIVSAHVGAAKALEMGPILGIPASQLMLGIGYANAGIIAGTGFAGAFDKGGYISSGQTGIVSEYGDELVNGVLVKGPARVTSREETNNIMNQGGSTSLTYAPVISGVLDSGDLDKILVKNYKGVERAMAKANRQRRKS